MDSAHQAFLSLTISWSLLKLTSIESWCHPIISPSVLSSPAALNLSWHQGLFQWIRSSHQVAKILELQLQHQSFQRIFMVNFLSDWLAWSPFCQKETLKNLLQNHISKASVLQCSVFIMAQLSQSYMITGKTIVLTMWIFVGKMMSLLFNTISRFVIAFLPRSKCISIPCLESPSAVIFEPPK